MMETRPPNISTRFINAKVKRNDERGISSKRIFILFNMSNDVLLRIPNLGKSYSQRGNKLFPTWERFIPSVGKTIGSLAY